MSKIIITVLTIFIIICCISPSRTQKLETHIFNAINQEVHDIFNKIFNSLELSHNYTEKNSNKLLISMLATIKVLAEKQNNVYEKILRHLQLNIKSKPNDTLFDLSKLTEIMINENLTPFNTSKIIKTTNEKKSKSLKFLINYLFNNTGPENPENSGADFPMEMQDLYKKIDINNRTKLEVWQHEMENNNGTRRLYGGDTGKGKQYPFLVSIHISGDFVCAGSVISTQMVITAATCLKPYQINKTVAQKNVKSLTIRTLNQGYPESIDEYECSKVYFHPDFDPATLEHNLAIVKATHKFNAGKVRKVSYRKWIDYNPSVNDHKLKSIFTVGWGDEGYDSNLDTVSFSELKITNHKDCVKTYSGNFVTTNNFCAGNLHTKTGSCKRDIGSPGIGHSRLVGIVSFGPPLCGTLNAPTVFTLIAFYIPWIDCIIAGGRCQREMPSQQLRSQWESLLVPERRSYNMRSMKHKQLHPNSAKHIRHKKIANAILKLLDNNERDIDDVSGISDATEESESETRIKFKKINMAPVSITPLKSKVRKRRKTTLPAITALTTTFKTNKDIKHTVSDVSTTQQSKNKLHSLHPVKQGVQRHFSIINNVKTRGIYESITKQTNNAIPENKVSGKHVVNQPEIESQDARSVLTAIKGDSNESNSIEEHMNSPEENLIRTEYYTDQVKVKTVTENRVIGKFKSTQVKKTLRELTNQDVKECEDDLCVTIAVQDISNEIDSNEKETNGGAAKTSLKSSTKFQSLTTKQPPIVTYHNINCTTKSTVANHNRNITIHQKYQSDENSSDTSGTSSNEIDFPPQSPNKVYKSTKMNKINITKALLRQVKGLQTTPDQGAHGEDKRLTLNETSSYSDESLPDDNSSSITTKRYFHKALTVPLLIPTKVNLTTNYIQSTTEIPNTQKFRSLPDPVQTEKTTNNEMKPVKFQEDQTDDISYEILDSYLNSNNMFAFQKFFRNL